MANRTHHVRERPPELGNDLAHLELMPSTLNLRKSAKVGDRQKALVRALVSAGVIDEGTCARIQNARTSVGDPWNWCHDNDSALFSPLAGGPLSPGRMPHLDMCIEALEAVSMSATGDFLGDKPFLVKARPMNLRAGVGPLGFSKLADDLEASAFLDSTRCLEARKLPLDE